MVWRVPRPSKNLEVLCEVGKEQKGASVRRGCTVLCRDSGGATVQLVWPVTPPPRGEWHMGIWFLQLLTYSRVKAGRSVAAR